MNFRGFFGPLISNIFLSTGLVNFSNALRKIIIELAMFWTKFMPFVNGMRKKNVLEVISSTRKYMESFRVSMRIFHLWNYVMNLRKLPTRLK